MDEWDNVTCTYFEGSFLNYSHLDVIARCYASPAFGGDCVLNSCHTLTQKLCGIRKHLDSWSTQAGLSAYMHRDNYQLHAFLEFDREQLIHFYYTGER